MTRPVESLKGKQGRSFGVPSNGLSGDLLLRSFRRKNILGKGQNLWILYALGGVLLGRLSMTAFASPNAAMRSS